MSRRVMIAGIGNIFLSDDAFGVEVATALVGRELPPGVRVAEFGIRGVHLAYELLEGYDTLILVDAVPMGEPPGTLAVIEPDPAGSVGGDADPLLDAHSMTPEVVLATLARLGGALRRTFVVGCQPATLDEGMGLSPPVAAAVASAADLCLELVDQVVQPAGKEATG